MQQVRKVFNVTKTASLFIFVKLGNFAHRKSMFYIANQEPEFTARVAAHQQAGTDMAAESTNAFLWDQWRLLAYRVVKCREEWDWFKSEGWRSYFNPFKWTIKGVVVEAKFLIHLLAFYIAGVMVGRNSIFPLLEPESPFVEGLKYVNPNTNR